MLREVLLEPDAERGRDVEVVGLADEADGRRAGVDARRPAPRRSRPSGPMRLVMPKAVSRARPSVGAASKKRAVGGVGAGPAALDVVDAEAVQRLGRSALVVDGEVDALALLAVAERGVVEVEALAGHDVNPVELAPGRSPGRAPTRSRRPPGPSPRCPPRPAVADRVRSSEVRALRASSRCRSSVPNLAHRLVHPARGVRDRGSQLLRIRQVCPEHPASENSLERPARLRELPMRDLGREVAQQLHRQRRVQIVAERLDEPSASARSGRHRSFVSPRRAAASPTSVRAPVASSPCASVKSIGWR